MEKIYDNYEYALNNNLFLNTFIQDYKNNDSYCYEEDDKIILKTELSSNSNTYIKFKELYLDKKTGLPKELIIKDNTKNTYISIIYNDIKICHLSAVCVFFINKRSIFLYNIKNHLHFNFFVLQ